MGRRGNNKAIPKHDVCSLKHSSSLASEAMENFEEHFGSFGMLTGGSSEA